MPATEENATLKRIQREISDVLEREKELRRSQSSPNENINNNDEHEMNNNITPQISPVKPVLRTVKSTSVMNGAVNGTRNNSNGIRLFTANATTKGVMHKFIKARGKMNIVNGLQATPLQIQQQQQPVQQTWMIPDVIEPPKVTEPGQYVRKGYVPVQVRMQKELEELHLRELELRTERMKSQPDFSDDDLDMEAPQLETTLKATRSMAQLYDPDEYGSDFNLASPGMKPARSLAELCDASEDELELPGSHSLIMRFEEIIQKNQQERS